MTEDNTKEVNKYSKHLESTSQNIKYAIDRFDILIISLSSGGLLFTTSLVKDFTDGCHCHASSLYLMKLAWGCFVLSICSNLISQVSSYFANTYELKIVKQIVRNKKDENNKIDVSKDEKAKSKYNKMTEYLNAASLIFFLLAVILSFTYFSKII